MPLRTIYVKSMQDFDHFVDLAYVNIVDPDKIKLTFSSKISNNS
jgi:hypothetical protein